MGPSLSKLILGLCLPGMQQSLTNLNLTKFMIKCITVEIQVREIILIFLHVL